MTEFITELMNDYAEISYLISILVNVLISLFAFIPSVFITAANIYVFGFWEGLILSLVGEVLGSVISLILYRKGIEFLTREKEITHPIYKKLLTTTGVEAFLLIVSLRLLPFVPSGLVNIGASFSKVSVTTFGIATLIGKIPAVLIEAMAVSQYMKWQGEEKVYFTLVALILVLIYFLVKRKRGI
ncbi:putative membrane protein YdjX (TVP38/TMEM64 family) [Bacillus mesophilus]|uniref:TVP38/TMEM64 family membrane protein n=1 Tax=Bacillus mesophilus TaxID=1808955 RepID=A0A6M0Q765_9BACI|nr:VTT domain-containing protein [Bacillus mesophilus]MBM7661504.1 putative membrane protein YdjX (TVP38/TMEM64 family) [Bacillus mesophilus]NEY72174.1 TVP38/TMEM64 family protein [Bacillus mesophilus]